MIRAYVFLLRPTAKQAVLLEACLEDHRTLYNAALEERREAWRRARVSIRYGDQSAQLKAIRHEDPSGQGRWSFSSQQATLRRLDKAMAAFFRRVRTGGRPGYPRFKGRGWFDTVEWPRDGDGCRWDTTPDGPLTRVYLQAVGHVRVHQHRKAQGRVKTIGVTRRGRRWHVHVTCDDVPNKPLPLTGLDAGIDMGVAHFATTSDGRHVPNPRFLAVSARALAEAQQVLAAFPSRARSRTKAHRQAVRKVAAIHAKIARQRADHAHKTALALLRRYDTIVHERLTIANMTRAPKPRLSPGQPGEFLANRAAAKAGLNRAILDAGWGMFLRILAGKAESAGRLVIAVDATNTSRTCPRCGCVRAENRVSQAEFSCVACGWTGNADYVGAVNIVRRAGLARRGAGGPALGEARRSCGGRSHVSSNGASNGA